MLPAAAVSGSLGTDSGSDVHRDQASEAGEKQVLVDDSLPSEQAPAKVLVQGTNLTTAKESVGASVAKRSWVKVAKNHVVTKQKFVVEEVDGQGQVVVPREVFESAKPLWEDFLIGKFSGSKAPHVGKVHMIVNKIWRLGDKTSMIDIIEVNDTTLKLRVRSEVMRRRILNRAMWNIMALPMIVSKWSPYPEETQPARKSIQLWVKLKEVPHSLFIDKGLEFLASAVGTPIRLHPNTEECVSFDEAQILVEVDLTKTLPTEYVIRGEEDGELDAVVKYSYPWLPPRCSACQKWGHIRDSCLTGAQAVSSATTGSDLSAVSGPSVLVAEETLHVTDTSQAVVDVVLEKNQVTSGSAGGEEVEKQVEREPGQEWITPQKKKQNSGSRHISPTGDAGSLLSNSYSVLCGMEEGGEAASGSTGVVSEENSVNTSTELGDGQKDHGGDVPDQFQKYKEAPPVLKLPDQESEFFCSFVYGSSSAEERKVLWSELRDHYDSPIIRNKPWMLVGDFNETLDIAEHSNVDDHPMVTSGMREFQNVVTYCAVTDIHSHGPLYTWCNKRETGLILKKLDRVLVNDVWLQAYPTLYIVFDAGGCSDHLQSRISLNTACGSPVPTRKPFKFVNAVTGMAEFAPLVADYWHSTEPTFMSTSTMFRFTKKLKALKPLVRNLAKEKMGNLVKRTKEAYDLLCQKQELNLANPSPQALREELDAYTHWDRVAAIEEKILKQRSKLHWLQIGDRNNKTFHRAVTARKAHNTVREIHCSDCTVTTKGEEIKVEAERVLEDLEDTSTQALQDLLSYRCSARDCSLLTRPVTAEEIKKGTVQGAVHGRRRDAGRSAESMRRASYMELEAVRRTMIKEQKLGWGRRAESRT
ncbi:PREDICTED: uncharacterized protein LOC104759539 [Camelina sativa]|uniref:Uncharacterized protein LOC104759539 n=1 Tax=Camelina sativa TaxID=90675 RepID=A0ABM0X4X6_CAMSA|nr:PREDICTED: uncharacterized protein LOC104759539 [Camelina sativa]